MDLQLLLPVENVAFLALGAASFAATCCCFRKVPGPSETALKVLGPRLRVAVPCGNALWWSDAASGRAQALRRVS